MRSLSRFREAFYDFPWTAHDFSCFSTTFRVDRLRFLRAAQPVLPQAIAQLLRIHAQ